LGDVIAFKEKKAEVRMKPQSAGSAKIIIFTGIWREPIDATDEKKSPTWRSGKASAAGPRRRLRGKCKAR